MRKALDERYEVILQILGGMQRGDVAQRIDSLVADDGLLDGGEAFKF